MHAWLDWLAALPAPWLYSAIAVAAFLENVFPPLPADTIVALGAFAAARGAGSATGAWAATMIGNLGGAMCMFALGRRVGVVWLTTRFPRVFPAEATAYVAQRFRERGTLALVISRFVPGVRAVVPPVAGAMGVSAVRAAIAMSVASGAWYGVVCVLAFRAGANADQLLSAIARQQRLAGLTAVALVAILVAVVMWRRRRRV
jgi:membrane protein DedA with SNARE-associated domain